MKEYTVTLPTVCDRHIDETDLKDLLIHMITRDYGFSKDELIRLQVVNTGEYYTEAEEAM